MDSYPILAQEMLLSGSLHQAAWGLGVGRQTRENPGRNLTGDPWFTEGHRLVLFLTRQATPPDAVRLLDWREQPERNEDGN